MAGNRDEDLAKEIRRHLELEAEERAAGGLTPRDAMAEARRAFGNVTQVQEETRAMWTRVWLEQASQDIGYAVRGLARHRAFTIVTLLTLALGIGANSAIFSIVNAVLLVPLRIPDADRLVRMQVVTNGRPSPIAGPQELEAWGRLTEVFAGVTAHRLETVNLTGGVEPEQVPVGRVTAGFFQVFRAPIARGRVFTTDEDRPGGEPIVVLSHGLWIRLFGSDAQVIGRSITLGSVAHRIVGVLDRGFETEQFDTSPALWVPFQIPPGRPDGGNLFQVSARLASDVTHAMADARLASALTALRSGPSDRRQLAWRAVPLQEAMVGPVRSSLVVMLAAVALVLLIACANVANLLLARADARQQEMALRAAIGAGRGRLVRQLLTESVVLSLAAGVLGLLGGTLGLRLMLSLNPVTNPFKLDAAGGIIPRIGEGGAAVGLDWRVLAFTLAISVATGIVFGLWPAFRAIGRDVQSALRGGSTGLTSRRAPGAVLVVVEVALALMLTAGAALLIRTMRALDGIDPGFDAERVLTMRMSVAGTRFETRSGLSQLSGDGLARVRTIPGVTAVTASCCMPLETVWQLPFVVGSRPAEGLIRSGRLSFHGFGGWHFVTPGYFDVLGIPLLRGRDFTSADNGSAPGVVIINEEMARRFWPSGNPLDDRLIVGRGMRPEYDADPIRQVIGIVGNMRDTGVTTPPRPAMYVPMAQVPDGVTALNVRLLPIVWMVRTAGDPYVQAAPVSRALQTVSELPVAHVRSMEDVVAESTARPRFHMWLMTIFGASALVLGAIGVYGLMAHWVRQRTREISIRLALGATAGQLRGSILRQGLMLSGMGVALGLGGAFALAQVMQGLLFGVTARDPLVFGVVPVIVTAAAALASYMPARRATQVDPIAALRGD
jgi:putative ABC transport system permease protein